MIDNRAGVRGTSGNGLLIGAVIVVLAVIAFYIFGPGATETVAATGRSSLRRPSRGAGAGRDGSCRAGRSGRACARRNAAPADQAAPAPQTPARRTGASAGRASAGAGPARRAGAVSSRLRMKRPARLAAGRFSSRVGCPIRCGSA